MARPSQSIPLPQGHPGAPGRSARKPVGGAASRPIAVLTESCSRYGYDVTINGSKPGVPGPLHKIPTDLRIALSSEAKTQAAWKDLTPLARNEWSCWVISAKQETTRSRRIQRAIEDLQAGKRRPCCWPGCPHRRPSAMKLPLAPWRYVNWTVVLRKLADGTSHPSRGRH
jgi:hypothetical protein